MQKKIKRKKLRSIGKKQSKLYCKFSNTKCVLFYEVVKRRKQKPESINKRWWLRFLKPSFLFNRITEIIKAMF